MVNAFSNSLSNLRDRLSGRSGEPDYEDYGEYAYDENEDYGEYGYGNHAGDPYDDIDDAEGVGEVRTRAASSSRPSNYPPLVSYKEARANSYVSDRLMRDPLEKTAARYRRPGSDYTPRIRDAVNVGRSGDYDFDTVSTETAPPAEAPLYMERAGVEAPAAGSAASSSYDPYAAFQGAGSASHSPERKLKVFAPIAYAEVEGISRSCKAGDVVVLTLTRTPDDLARRILDFSFGAASVVDANVDCVAEKVFVIARGHGLTASERKELQAQGIILR